MDTILDFSLTKSAHGAAASHLPVNAGSYAAVNLENLNLSATLNSLLKAAVAPSAATDAWAPALRQPASTPSNSAAAQLIQQLSAALNSTNNGGVNVGDSLSTNLTNVTTSPATYTLLVQQHLQQQQQQQQLSKNNQQGNILRAFVQSLLQANAFQNTISNNVSKDVMAIPVTTPSDYASYSSIEPLERIIKPSAKRQKITSTTQCDFATPPNDVKLNLTEIEEVIKRKSPPGGLYCNENVSNHDSNVASSTSSVNDNTAAINSEYNLAQDSLTRINASASLSCLHMSGVYPPSVLSPPPRARLTPSRASSLASASSCVSSTQNSPSSTSLRRHSSASTAVSAAMSVRNGGTPQRRAAAPIPDNLKDEAYYERRKKNNDAAKRSRDQRRRKEEETAQKAAVLEQENTQLRTQVCLLQAEIKKLHALILTNSVVASPITCVTQVSSPSDDVAGLVVVAATGTYDNHHDIVEMAEEKFCEDDKEKAMAEATCIDEKPMLSLTAIEQELTD